MKVNYFILFVFLSFVALGLSQSSTSPSTGATGTGGTTSAACQDYSTDCAASVSECNNTIYKPLMCGLCKKTCNFCSASPDPCAGVTPVTPPPTTPDPSSCVDVDPNCGSDVSECTNPLYIPLMCKYCKVSCFMYTGYLLTLHFQKTCGFCSTSGGTSSSSGGSTTPGTNPTTTSPSARANPCGSVSTSSYRTSYEKEKKMMKNLISWTSN